MKKIIISLFVIICTLQVVYSQSGWFWQNPLPQGNLLHAVTFINRDSGMAVGISGTLMITTNGGQNWNIKTIYRNFVCRDIQINNHICYVSGINFNPQTSIYTGYLFRSTDFGNSWVQVLTENEDCYNALYFINEFTGFLAGGFYGKVKKTTNGGLIWSTQQLINESFINDIEFSDNNTGYILFSNGKIFKSTNCGVNWFQLTGTILTGYGCEEIRFPSTDTGYVSYSSPNKIFKTTNRGITWDSVVTNSTLWASSLDFINSKTGFAAGYGGKVIKTTNGGLSWNQLTLDTNIPVYDICMIDSQYAFLTGDKGTIYKTIDYGNNWNNISHGNRNWLFDIYFIDLNTGIAAGDGLILRTTNSGLNWNIVFSDNVRNFRSIFFIDNNTGFAAGNNWIFKTNNGGANWSWQNTNLADNFYSIFFINQNTGYLAGDSGRVLITTDQGISWSLFVRFNANYLFNVYFYNSQTGFVLGELGKIYKTSNAGFNWVQQSVQTTNYLFSIQMLNELTGYIAGGTGPGSSVLRKTTDGGNNWTLQNSPLNDGLRDIYFFNVNEGIAVGDKGIIKTTNGGNNWIELNPLHSGFIGSIYFLNSNTGYIAGANGAILKTTDGGGLYLSINSENFYQPYSHSLYQNYPNPFNPVTKIRFDIPVGNGRDRSVRVIVYDLLGRVVATLVNQLLKPGTYEVEFNGSSFASGIYFYKLFSDDFIDAKRMVLLK
jgi:photosystem II stability/assembly factor-like uncharacterized protein